jgi:hypothetical protein
MRIFWNLFKPLELGHYARNLEQELAAPSAVGPVIDLAWFFIAAWWS